MPEVFLSAFFIFVDITKNIGSQLHKKMLLKNSVFE